MRVRGRQSFASWKLPPQLDGLLLLEDLRQGSGYRSQDQHSHDELELHLIERGHAVFLLPERKLEAPAGTLLWIPPGHAHLVLDTSADLRRWLLLARRRLARRVLPREALTRALQREQVARLAPRGLNALRTTFMELGNSRSAQEILPRLGLVNAGIAYALARAHALTAAAAADDDAGRQSFHRAVVAALAALRGRVPPPSLPELAALTHTSQAHLSKLFSADVGVSVTEFRNRLRLARFFELYGDGSDKTLLAAALDAGFGSYPQFHRVFKRQMGHAPGRRRRT